MSKGLRAEVKFDFRRLVAVSASVVLLSFSGLTFCIPANALDCTKAPDSKTKACKALQQSTTKTSQSEEVNAASALAQKNAAIAARKAAEAKASKSPGTVSTPVATVIPVPKVSTLSTASPAASALAAPNEPPIASASPSASMSSSIPQKKSRITCVKGTTTKVIVAVSPKCPNGYKKK